MWMLASNIYKTTLAFIAIVGFCLADDTDSIVTCNTQGYTKVLLNQTEGGQYLEYVTDVPELSGFTLHYWVQILEPRTLAPILSYLADGPDGKEYVQVTLLKTGDSWFCVLQVKGVVVSNTKLPDDFFGQWNHFLHSWDGNSGVWSVYLDGTLIDEGIAPRSANLTVRGGGRIFTGQQASSIINSFANSCSDISKFKEGISGWITLLGMDTRAISRPNYWVNRMAVSVVANGCHVEHKGDIISWVNTPRKGYCGTMEAKANNICKEF